MRARCDCCGYKRHVQPLSIKRARVKILLDTDVVICSSCWYGKGPSFPVVYFP